MIELEGWNLCTLPTTTLLTDPGFKISAFKVFLQSSSTMLLLAYMLLYGCVKEMVGQYL